MSKERNWKVFLPVVLGLGLVAVDKVALIPAFQECCTGAQSSDTFHSAINYDFRSDAMITRARAEGRKVAMNFGSSRSLPFYGSPTRTHIRETPFLTDGEKTNTLRWEVVNNAAAGGTILFEYVRLQQWLDHGVRPDVFFVELSEASVVSHLAWFPTEVKFGVPAEFAVRHVFDLPYEHTKKILGSRVFELSRHRVLGPKTAFDTFLPMMRQFENLVVVRPENTIVNAGVPAGTEPPATLLTHTYMVNVMERDLFGPYKVDPVLEEYVFLILRKSRAAGIPVVFWRPPNHPSWQVAVDRSMQKDNARIEKSWQKLVRRIEAEGGTLLDMTRPGTLKCNYFFDPVHVGEACVPEMFARQVAFFEQTAAE